MWTRCISITARRARVRCARCLCATRTVWMRKARLEKGAWRQRCARRRRNVDHHGEHVNIHEYQAKDIFRRSGIPIPPGEVASTPEEAERFARGFGGTV